MAVFDPQVSPTQDPNYLSYSKVVEAPQANTSKRLALEAAGEGLSGAVALTDQTIKKGIDNDVNEQVDVERDKFTDALTSMKKQLDQGQIPGATQTVSGNTTGKSLLDANAQMSDDESVPPEVDSGVDRINQLTQAKRAGSIKLNDTLYSGQVLSIAKQLRAQYPTYREYIDQKVSQASGLPVANAYYQNMMLDVNRQLQQLSQANKQKDEIGNLMVWSMKSGNDEMAAYILKRQKDPNSVSDADILGSVSRFAAQKATLATQAAERDSKKFDRETQVQNETKNAVTNVNNLVNGAISDEIAIGGNPTVKSLIDYFDNYQSGSLKGKDADETTAQQRAEQLGFYENYYRRKAKALVAPAEALGIDGEKIVENALTPITTYTKLMRDKQFGPASFHNRQIQAVKDDEVHNNWLFDKDRAALSRRLLGLREITGEMYFQDYIKGILVTGQDKPIKDLFSQEALSAVMPVEDQRGQTNPRFITDAIKHAKEVGVNDFNYYGGVVEWSTKLTDPNMPLAAKDRLVDWAFNPKNNDLLDEFKMDYRNPNKPDEWVPGKYRAFNIMGSDRMSDAIAETAKVHPENYQKYQGWMENSFAKLYREDVQTLNKLAQDKTVNVHFGYNGDSKEYVLVDKNNSPITRENRFRYAAGDPQRTAVYLDTMLDVLERVNSGIGRMAVAYKANPNNSNKDVDKYLLQTLQTTGFRPGSNLTNASEGMAKALIMSRHPDMTPEELNKKFLSKDYSPVQGLE